MELIIFIIVISIFVGLTIAFINAVASTLTQEDFDDLLEKKENYSERLKRMKLHSDETINTFLSIEVFCYIIAAVLIGAYTYFRFDNWLYIVQVIIIITVALLFIRTFFYSLGKRFGETLAVSLLPVLGVLTLVSKPVYYIIFLIMSKFGVLDKEEATIEELSAMVDNAHEEGSIDADEYRILKNVIRFSDIIVSDVMTPRTVVFSCEAEKTVSEVVNLPEIQMYSRIPIYEGASLDDNAYGYVMSKDILYAALKGNGNTKLKEFSREIQFIPENADLDNTLDLFLKRKQHIFLAVDEYGGIEGLITMEDVLETILGTEIVDEADKVVDLREYAKQKRNKRVAMFSNQSESV